MSALKLNAWRLVMIAIAPIVFVSLILELVIPAFATDFKKAWSDDR